MRASVKRSIALSVAAMTLGFGTFAAAAHPWYISRREVDACD
jgi:hypothetical protein